jgi:starvation-inducible DNA-binding protein
MANPKRVASSKAPSPQAAPIDRLSTPTDLKPAAVAKVSTGLNTLLADVFALYLKTKNFHWHLSGRHFRDYHLLLDEQAEQLYAMTDPLAERVRKLGRPTIRSIGEIARLQRIEDNDAGFVEPEEMLAQLCRDNGRLAAFLRDMHGVCEDAKDIATASLLEAWTDETERRTWFLFEASQPNRQSGR